MLEFITFTFYPPFLRKLFKNLYQKNGIKPRKKCYEIKELALEGNNRDTKVRALKQIWRKKTRYHKINVIKRN